MCGVGDDVVGDDVIGVCGCWFVECVDVGGVCERNI